MIGDRIDTRTPPCGYMGDGRLCGRTDDRPTILDRVLGPICRAHRPELMPKPKVEVQHA